MNNSNEPSMDQLNILFNLCNSNKYQEAIEKANQLLQIYPKSVNLYNILGASLNFLKLFDHAINAYKEAIAINPTAETIYNNLGNAQKNNGDLNASIESFENAININPNYAEAYYNLGITNFIKRDYDASFRNFSKSLEIKPNLGDSYYNIGNIHYEKKEYDLAIKNYNKAIELIPNHFDSFNNLGNVYKDIKNYKMSLKCYLLALEINPNLSNTKKNLGELYYSLEDYEKAKKCFQEFNDAKSVAKVIECSYQNGNINDFVTEINKVKLKNECNVRVAAVSTFGCNQFKIKDIYPFCHKPEKLFLVDNLENYIQDYQTYIQNLSNEVESLDNIWETPHTTTRNGFQTTGNLFSDCSKNLKILEKIITNQLEKYFKKYYNPSYSLFKNWPTNLKLNGWYVKLLQEGHQESHIHPDGLVSGVFYLKVVQNPTEFEGAIELSQHGYNYKVLSHDYPRIMHQPKIGDLILFPSSLFHKTIPVKQNVERCVIAFDLLPA